MSKREIKHIKVLSENLFPVVGVGASAGGMEAFKALVKAIPENTGMAYILLQHLSPKYESILPEILQKTTSLPVVQITDNLKVLPDHIYVIPSNRMLEANDGILQLSPRVKGEKTDLIDVFFTSLAEIHQEYAIGVVLSGTGSDGTVGLKTIKDQGGITVAQDEASAAYYGMPQSAIKADVVDFVLPPDQIPKHLLEVIRSSKLYSSDVSLPVEFNEEESFRQILALLKTKQGVDFTYYKQTTIRRRILRRKALNKLDKLKDYIAFLLENKSEQVALFKDMLIPVTAFFRDPTTFETLLKTVFPLLFKEKNDTDVIRIWVAGCSSGEEAYSMAMCLHEYFNETIATWKVQLFATDVSEEAIAKARRGIYQKKDMAGLSETQVKTFFTRVDGSYQVNKEIRQLCVFACHNLLKDPPFAKMDLISCRNVLIYMEPYLQKKAFATFHYALNGKGVLVLGKSETVGQPSDLFQSLNQQEKIYTRKTGAGKYIQVATESSETALKHKNDQTINRDAGKDDFGKAADNALLNKYASVGVVVNEQLDIVQFRGRTTAYLEAPPGRATHNVLTMAREGLSFELRNALHKAKAGLETVIRKAIPMENGTRSVDIEIIPLPHTIDPYFLVLFGETKEEAPANVPNKKKKRTGKEETQQNAERLRIEHLEKELAQLREDMRSITEDQEAANEELQSANEELLSGSEELQSLNEELETTKEEIQSSNEELTTLNQELIERNEQLNYSRKYAEAIVTTIHEPLLILSKDLQIRSANPCFYEKFSVTEQQTEGKMFFEWGEGLWNINGLRERLQNILPQQSFFEKFEASVTLPYLGQRILLLNARQIVNDSSNEKLILLAIRDVTDQKAFEQELEQQVFNRTKELEEANRQLRHSNENLQQFASIASHDLQEPLRKLKLFASVLKRFDEELPAEGKELIGKISVTSDRMSQLIREVLQYSKIAYTPKEFVPTNLDAILQNVLGDQDLLQKETAAVIEYPRPLPEIEAIPPQMNQLFYNLLTNALKFRKNDVMPVICISYQLISSDQSDKHLELKEDTPYLEIVFSDNGIGFDQKYAEQIFQIFERLHSVDDFEGTGVGLALCKKIVENHFGHIYAVSAEERGASFYVLLPIHQ